MPDPLNLNTLPQQTWQRVSDLFDEVIELAEGERITFIRRLWVNEPEIASELAALLVAAAKVDKAAKLAQAPFDSALQDALATQNAAAYRPGQKFGPWTLEECIGSGGMGEVWRAKRSDGLYKASAALKLLRSDIPNEKLSARFRRERLVLARLNHPNIARLLDAGVEKNQAFIVLELVNGIPMLDYVTAHTRTLADRLRLIRDIALAVEHAHSQLVLHRDLKPSNVLVTTDGQVKLLDFGIAGVLDTSTEEPMTKLTQLTGRGLTLEYASPEQITGEPTMAASDVYSLGVLMFHLCTGNRPFAGSSTRAALEYAMVNSDPPLASASISKEKSGPFSPVLPDQIIPPSDTYRLRGDLDAIIRRAMRLTPEERYPTAAALATDLDAWMSQRPTSRHAGDHTHATRLWFRRHWKIVSTISTAVVLVIAGLGVSLWHRSVTLSTLEATARHLDGVMAQLPALVAADADATIETKRQYADLLVRLQRPTDALTVLDELTPVVVGKHGKASPVYGKLQRSRAVALKALGRNDEANAAEREAAAIAQIVKG